jgi:hypothetical protein
MLKYTKVLKRERKRKAIIMNAIVEISNDLA